MKKFSACLIVAAALAAPMSAIAQGVPGAPDSKRIIAGAYVMDTHHTQVFWTVNHMGITPLTGAFSAKDGMLELDPAKPANAKVSVTFDMAGMSTTVPALTTHLSSADFFDVTKFPTASFTSTAVQVNGDSAKISGNLTVKGVTKPVVLDAKLFGVGVNPMSKKLTVGFVAMTSVKRSDFGLGYALPVVGDQIELKITAAFEAK